MDRFKKHIIDVVLYQLEYDILNCHECIIELLSNLPKSKLLEYLNEEDVKFLFKYKKSGFNDDDDEVG